MKIFKAILLIIILMLNNFYPTIQASNQENIKVDKQAPVEISKFINDSVLFKFYLLDLGFDILAEFYGDDKDRMKDIYATIQNAIDNILKKYKIHDTKELMDNIEGYTDIPRLRIGGSGLGKNAQRTLYIPNDDWYEIVTQKKPSKLPVIKFRSEYIDLNSHMSVSFGNGIECIIDNKEYIYHDGKWFEKQG